MIELPCFPKLFRRAILSVSIGASALFSPVAMAQSAIEVQASVGGQQVQFEAADSEVLILRSGEHPVDELKQLIQSGVEGAAVVKYSGTRAVVQLAKPFEHAKAAGREDAVSKALPDVEVQPVLYMKGLPRRPEARHFGTRDVLVKLPAGKTAAELVAQAGAQSSRPTVKDGYVMLTFSTAHKALAAVPALRGAGVDARPQIAAPHQLMAPPPSDRFFENQWHLFNVGQGGGQPGIDANVLPAWDITLGKGAIISVVDDCLETRHPDLRDNAPAIQTNVHYDFNDKDNDPRPGPDDAHGTAVGGVAAARQNNGNLDPVTGKLLGVSGSAPEAKVIGLRLLGGNFTDEDSAGALYWRPTNTIVDVSNNSWGRNPVFGLGGADVLHKAAVAKAADEGRGGRGQITLFAAGNGKQNTSNSNYSTYSNDRHVLAVSAVDNFGGSSFYSEPGANIMVSAPSNGGSLGITTTDVVGVNGYNPQGPGNLPVTDYTNDFGGTSSATPLTAGGVALMLGANSDLGWRDVKEILASTARRVDPGDADWDVNEGGFKFNHKYGGGMIDLRAAVTRALTWVNLGTEVSQEVSLPVDGAVRIPDGPFGSVSRTFDFGSLPNLRLEQIEIVVDISHIHRSDLKITVTSPSGITSVLAERHFAGALDTDVDYKDNGVGWTFTSTHHWGENSKRAGNGVWTLTVADEVGGAAGVLNAATIRLWGTASSPTRVVFETPTYSINEAQVEDPMSVGLFVNAKQVIRVKRLGPLTGESTVAYTTTFGTATRPDNPDNLPADFIPVSGTLHFSPNQEYADADIVVEVLDDAAPEPVETINIVLNNPTGASLGGVTLATIDVIDSEQNFVTVAATDTSASETNNDVPLDPGSFTISRLTASAEPLTVNFTFNGSATFDDGITETPDYLPVPLSATIPAYENSVVVTFQPINDAVIEGVETVILALEPDAAYAVGAAATATVNLVDNDRQKVQIDNLDNQAVEADPTNTGHLRIVRSVNTNAPDAFALPLLVDLSLGGTQLPRDNYKLRIGDQEQTILPGTTFLTLEIPAGQSSLDVFIVPVQDFTYQATKTVVVGLRANPNYDFNFDFITETVVRIVEDDSRPETVIPHVTISAPANGARILKSESPSITLKGTASDNKGVDKVLVRINGGLAEFAQLATPGLTETKWSLVVDGSKLALGPNTIAVQSRDGNANNFNSSKIVVIRFNYIEKHALTVAIVGPGTVTDGFVGTTDRVSGKKLTITATPDAGSAFAGWFTGSGLIVSSGSSVDALLTSSNTIKYTMPSSDSTLIAKFVPSPFVPEISGKYSGLIEGPLFASSSSGFLKVKVDGTGAFTGTLIFEGVPRPVKGVFTVLEGEQLSRSTSSRAVYNGKLSLGDFRNPLLLSLSIDTDPQGTRQITGTVGIGALVANVVADRAAYSSAVPAPAELVHTYTVQMPPASPLSSPDRDPRGNGVATVTITRNGKVKWFGTLGDGTKVSQTTNLSKDGTWPLFVTPYDNRGVILGLITHDATKPESDLSGRVDWQRPALVGSDFYPLGFGVNDALFLGAIYTPPTAGRALTSFDTAPENKGTATLEEGNLISVETRQFEFKDTNILKFDAVALGTADNQLAVTIDPALGTFEGTFLHSVSGQITPVKGILYQKAGVQTMIGYFKGSSIPNVPRQLGRITLEANTPVLPPN